MFINTIRPFSRSLPACALLLGVLCIGSNAEAQTPVYEFRFNRAPANFAVNTGTKKAVATLYNLDNERDNLHGEAGSGVSGTSGDFAFDNTSATRMGGGDNTPSGGTARLTSDTLDARTSFTLQGWYKIDPSITGAYSNGRLISKGNNLNNVIGLHNQRNASGEGSLVFSLGTPTASNIVVQSDYNGLLGESGWVFFAVTYDSTQPGHQVKFYAGTPNDAVTMISEHELAAGPTGANPATLYIGGNGAPNIRPFHGWMDNIRIFVDEGERSGALSLSELEDFRLKDLQ